MGLDMNTFNKFKREITKEIDEQVITLDKSGIKEYPNQRVLDRVDTLSDRLALVFNTDHYFVINKESKKIIYYGTKVNGGTVPQAIEHDFNDLDIYSTIALQCLLGEEDKAFKQFKNPFKLIKAISQVKKGIELAKTYGHLSDSAYDEIKGMI